MIISKEKEQLRKIMLKKRKTILDREKKENLITKKLLDFFSDFKSVFIYVSFGSEVNTHGFIRSYSGNILVPKTQNGKMETRVLQSYENLQTDKFGNLLNARLGNEETAEAAIVPMLAFDLDCYRLGYGGGYYDKYLANYKGLKVGIAFDEQLCKKVPVDEFDIPLDCIITPSNYYKRINYYKRTKWE